MGSNNVSPLTPYTFSRKIYTRCTECPECGGEAGFRTTTTIFQILYPTLQFCSNGF